MGIRTCGFREQGSTRPLHRIGESQLIRFWTRVGDDRWLECSSGTRWTRYQVVAMISRSETARSFCYIRLNVVGLFQ